MFVQINELKTNMLHSSTTTDLPAPDFGEVQNEAS